MKWHRDDERVQGRIIMVAGMRYELAAPATKQEADDAEAAWALEARTLSQRTRA